MLYILTCAIRFPLYMLFNQEIRNAFSNEFVRTSTCLKFYKIQLKKSGKDTRLFNCLYKCCYCCYNKKTYSINEDTSSIETQNRKVQYQPVKQLRFLFLNKFYKFT